MRVEERMRFLERQVREHRYSYYVLNQPTISDFEYDLLEQELIKLELQYSDLVNVNSPTQRIGCEPISTFVKVKHSVPMLSLDNTYSIDELLKWKSRIEKKLFRTDVNFCAELKIDGISLSLVYKKRILAYAGTRGDGEFGEDVTENAKTIVDIPIILPEFAPIDLEVRGEVFLSRTRFMTINHQRSMAGEALFANTRNAASGTMRQLDSRVTASRLLSFFPWQWVNASDHNRSMEQLVTFGFNRIPFNTVGNMNDILNFIHDQRTNCLKLFFDVDGVVVKVNNLSVQKQLGCTSRAPRWAIAFKYPNTQSITKVIDIKWQVSRFGKLTPVAVLEPTMVNGSLIHRATLYNINEIQRLKICIGCSVALEKGGNVIPKIVSVINNCDLNNRFELQLPKICPSCFGSTKLVDDVSSMKILYCINYKCPDRLIARIEHLSDRYALDIQSLGQYFIEQLVDSQLFNDPWEIFKILKDQQRGLLFLTNIKHVRDTKARKLILALTQALTKPLLNWIYAIGIPMVGLKVAELLSVAFPNRTLHLLWKTDIDSLVRIDGVGHLVASAIKKFIDQYPNLPDQLVELDILPSVPDAQNIKLPLSDQVVVITGILKSMNRVEAEILLKRLGAKTSKQISKYTTMLLVGDKAGSKLCKAVGMNIDIKNESWLLEQQKIHKMLVI